MKFTLYLFLALSIVLFCVNSAELRSDTCTIQKQRHYPPDLPYFQPVFATFDITSDCLTQSFLEKATDNFDSDVNKCVNGYESDLEPINYICGLPEGNNFFLHQLILENCDDDNACLKYMDENTQKVTVTTDDHKRKYCNMIKQFSFNSTDKIQSPDSCLYDSPTHYTSNCDDFKACQTNPDTNNCPFKPNPSWECYYHGTGIYSVKPAQN
jgi:hypothetical protein